MTQGKIFMTSMTDPRPFEWPDLRAERVLMLDTETTGLEPFGGDRPVGFAVSTEDERAWYFPWAHQSGANLEREKVFLWAKDNLAGKTICNHTTKFDAHMLRAEGLDLELMGCALEDVQFAGALLDENALRYSLDDMARRYLNRRKLDVPMDGTARRIHQLEPELVAPYAMNDAQLVAALRKNLLPRIEAEELTEVWQLECDLIWCVVHMEGNGIRLDVDKLARWHAEIQSRTGRLMRELWELAGRRFEPNSTKEMAALFHALGVPPPHILDPRTQQMKPTFAGPGMELIIAGLGDSRQGRAIRAAMDIRQLSSIDTKFVAKYLREVGPGNILRYNLNQLKVDREGGGGYGAVTGRFSSSEVNIQQVPKPSKQHPVTRDFTVRECFLPGEGQMLLSGDASQIEYRIFAHYSGDEKLIAAYRDDPTTNIHRLVERMLNGVGAAADYDLSKNCNFMCVYGGGPDKLAAMVSKPLAVVLPVYEAYHQMFPTVRWVTQQATETAKKRGYVKTLLKRRRRYGKDDRHYSGFNAACQGSAADLNKLALRDSYRERKRLEIVMRLTVHDEVVTDVPGREQARRYREFLDIQRIPMKVPITWKVSIGPNWAQTEEVK